MFRKQNVGLDDCATCTWRLKSQFLYSFCQEFLYIKWNLREFKSLFLWRHNILSKNFKHVEKNLIHHKKENSFTSSFSKEKTRFVNESVGNATSNFICDSKCFLEAKEFLWVSQLKGKSLQPGKSHYHKQNFTQQLSTIVSVTKHVFSPTKLGSLKEICFCYCCYCYYVSDTSWCKNLFVIIRRKKNLVNTGNVFRAVDFGWSIEKIEMPVFSKT